MKKQWILSLPIVLVVILVLTILVRGGAFASKDSTAAAASTASSETKPQEPTEAEKAAAAKAAADKEADDNVRKIVPAEVDATDVEMFYKQYKDGLLMRNTWPSYAEDRKKNTEALLDNGLYGAVEFPVDIALKATSTNYVIDHEGGYSEKELEEINKWIAQRLKDKEVPDEEKELIIDWVCERIARDPIYGHMWAQAFAELHSWSGKTVREMYPWMDEFLIQWENGNRLETYSCRYEDKDGNVSDLYVTPEYQEIGYRLALTFVRLTVVNISKPNAAHWYMEEITNLPSQTTTVKADFLESEAAAVLAALDKNGKNVFKEKLALNLNDGRAEIVKPAVPKKKPVKPVDPVTPVKPVVPVKPQDPGTPGNPPNNPPGNPPTIPEKNPANDPVNQGNAEKGGGDNKPGDGPGEYQPTDPRTENPTGNENDNNHGHSDPATVTPSTPDPAPTNGTMPTTDPQGGENQMNYQPDPPIQSGPENGGAPYQDTNVSNEAPPL